METNTIVIYSDTLIRHICTSTDSLKYAICSNSVSMSYDLLLIVGAIIVSFLGIYVITRLRRVK